VVTTASLTDPALCVLLNQDEEIGYGVDEPDDLTRAPHAVTSTLAGRRALRLVVPW
jgi:hypothetical protein